MDFLNYIPEWMGISIMFVGLVVILVLIFLIISELWNGIKILIRRFIYYIHRKTRFHRKPIAKCYCRDCDYWHPNSDGTSGICWGHLFSENWTTADEWFCWDATPRKEERTDI